MLHFPLLPSGLAGEMTRVAQEVRSILFSAEEVHIAVTRLLMQRVRGLAPHQVACVEVHLREDAVHATVQFSKELNAKKALDPNELMSAMLLHCSRVRIPLSSRAQKRLGVIDGCLSLTTSLNLTKIMPWIGRETVVHAVIDPELLESHARSGRLKKIEVTG